MLDVVISNYCDGGWIKNSKKSADFQDFRFYPEGDIFLEFKYNGGKSHVFFQKSKNELRLRKEEDRRWPTSLRFLIIPENQMKLTASIMTG
jgi:hypothetical protein